MPKFVITYIIFTLHPKIQIFIPYLAYLNPKGKHTKLACKMNKIFVIKACFMVLKSGHTSNTLV